MLVWYAAYGSNLSRERFTHYLRGGRPRGARRTYPGARDTSLPRDDRPVRLPGRLHFGWESATWGGGIAFLEPPPAPGPDSDLEGGEDEGEGVLARGYLLTEEQFADVAAQEMARSPGKSLDLGPVYDGGWHSYGPGRYETVHRVGDLDGVPILTFTAVEPARLTPNPPTGTYLRFLVDGLTESHGLDPDQAASYLLRAPAVAAAWSRSDLVALADAAAEGATRDPI